MISTLRNPVDSITILGVKIHTLSRADVLSRIDTYLSENQFRHLVTVNPEFIVLAQRNECFREALNAADLSVADGVGALLASRYLGVPIPERITGIDLIPAIMTTAQQNGWTAFLLGSHPSVVEATRRILDARYPGVVIGAESGPIWSCPSDLESQSMLELVKRVRSSQATVVFVAFGAPKQEEFIARFRSQLGVKLAMGVGGSFDFISGRARRAPLWLRSLGLEWLHRLVRQPSRIRRICRAVVVFPWLVLRQRRGQMG